MLELKAVISKLLRNYRLSASNPEHELQLVAETVLKSTNGVRLRIHPRYPLQRNVFCASPVPSFFLDSSLTGRREN